MEEPLDRPRIKTMRLDECIAMVESSNNNKAIRFEPVMFTNKPTWVLGTLSKIAIVHECSRDTALAIACTSYGYYQILGANIYANGYIKTVFDYVFNKADQDIAFAKFIGREGFNSTDDISGWTADQFEKFATFYNGPGNIDGYIDRMEQAAGS